MSTPVFPVKLSGNLGDRHRCVNELVLGSWSSGVPFHLMRDLPEKSAVDRLFKIDLASKHKNVDYIMETLKGDDMLYVARALKCTWLLNREYSQIINPTFLENKLYPQMRLHAQSKMKNWIQLNLREPKRCIDFYEFYKDKDFEIAAKFLNHCSNEFILNEFDKILYKITPKLLKRLSEKVPRVTRKYFDSLKQDQTLLAVYLKNDMNFFATVKYLLKTDADVFFYVIENFFVLHKFSSFRSETTKYIMKYHKTRFMKKPELYSLWLLDIKTIAKCLASEEIKDLIQQLARAAYLGSRFSYQSVEPLIKALSVEERTAIKKQIFVDKDFGPIVKEWPYALPDVPKLKAPQNGLFLDKKLDPWLFGSIRPAGCCLKRELRCKINRKTLLDELFDQYRFRSYSQTLSELQKRLRVESSSQNRMYMLLVLVSKTGGRIENLSSYIDLLKQFKNEPAHIRAAIVRSLVKRAFVWRLPPEPWAYLLEWAHGLGLDGSAPEVTCSEGLHAVIMRDILAEGTCAPKVWKAFLKDFSSFNEYTLTVDERRTLRIRLPALLLAEAGGSSDSEAAERINQLLDTLSAYNIPFDQQPGIVDAIATIAKRDFDSAKPLLHRIYAARVARKALFKENFKLLQTDASYVNALRHGHAIFEEIGSFEKVTEGSLRHEKFLRKLSLYFAEKDGLARRYRAVLMSLASRIINNKTKEEQIKITKLGRPLALLAGTNFSSILTDFSSEPRVPEKQILASAMRANSHVVRPPFDIESIGWRSAGAKAVANRVATCRPQEVEQFLQRTLAWSRTMRLSLVLAERVDKEREAYQAVASKRPSVALKAALRYLRRRGNNSDVQIWKTVRPIMEKILKVNRQDGRRYLVNDNDSIPLAFKAEYYVILYNAYKKASIEIPMSLFRDLDDVLPDVDPSFLCDEIKYFLESDLALEIKIEGFYTSRNCSKFYFDMIAKYLLLGTSTEMAEERLQIVGELFFKRIEGLWKRFAEEKDNESVTGVLRIINDFLCSLKYSIVFFDRKYVCLPVFERLCEWMHGFLPIEQWFNVYAKLHLTMIYFKAVRLCLEKYPEIFSDDSKKLTDGVKILGVIFGKFLSNAVIDLTENYFPSIVQMYKEEVESYITFLCTSPDDSTKKFKVAVIKGMLSEQPLPSQNVALHIYAKYKYEFNEDPYLRDIKKILKVADNGEVRFQVEVNNLIDTV